MARIGRQLNLLLAILCTVTTLQVYAGSQPSQSLELHRGDRSWFAEIRVDLKSIGPITYPFYTIDVTAEGGRYTWYLNPDGPLSFRLHFEETSGRAILELGGYERDIDLTAGEWVAEENPECQAAMGQAGG